MRHLLPYRLRRLAICTSVFFLLAFPAPFIAAQQAAPNPPQVPKPMLTPEQQEAERYLNEGRNAYKIGDYDKALKAWEIALEKARAIKDEARIAACVNNLGAVYYSTGRYDKALKYFNESLEIRKKNSDPNAVADSLSNIGAVYLEIDQYEQALEFAEQALEIRRKLVKQEKIADSFINIGNIYLTRGDYNRALNYYYDAIKIYDSIKTSEPLKNLYQISVAQDAVGTIYQHLNEYDQAAYYHAKSLAGYQILKRPDNISVGLNNLAIDYYDAGMDEKTRDRSGNTSFIQATDYFEQALKIQRGLNKQEAIATLVNNLAMIYWAEKNYEKAKTYFTDAVETRRRLDKQPDVAESLDNLADLCYELQEYDMAQDYANQSRKIYEAQGREDNRAKNFSRLGDLDVIARQWNKAESMYARAVVSSDLLSKQVNNPSQIGNIQQKLPHLYERYALALVKDNRTAEALAIVESGRAQGLARQITLNGSDYTAYFTADEKKQLQKDTADLTAFSKLLSVAEAKLASCKPEQQDSFERQKKEYQKKQADAEQKYTAYRDFLFAHYPQFREVSGQHPPTVAELQELAQRNPDTLYLTWAVVDDKTTLLFALTDKKKDGLKAFVLPVGETELRQMAQKWEKKFGSSAMADAQQSRALYDALFAPLEKEGLMRAGRYKRIVTIASGPLLDIPFAALLNGKGERLIENYAVSSTLALGMFNWQPNPRAPKTTMLCVADPTGKATDPKPKDVSLRRAGFDSLPGARKEGEAVAHLFHTEPLIGPAASKAAILKRIEAAKILHFATHGYLNSKAPQFSGLVLAPPVGTEDDGCLSAEEILNLPLAARLAVLSACETGRGVEKGGEGLMGLVWAFEAAGCKSVVASQWQVDDKATRELMLTFYHGIQVGKRKDDAMRDAMLQVKKQKGWSAPYFWAAFQVIGDTTPLPH